MNASRILRGAPTRVGASLAFLALATVPLQAQRCLGFPGFSQPLRIDGQLVTGSHRTDLLGRLEFGQAGGVFGGGQIGVGDYDNSSGSALLVGGNIGTQVQLGTASRTSSGAQLCPVAGIDYRSGPNRDGIDQSGLDVRGGLSLGTAVGMAEGVQFAPFGTVSLAYTRATASVGSTSVTNDDVGAVIDLGAGFIFSNRFTLRPHVGIPVGLDREDPRFGLAVGYSFGGR